MHTKTLVKTPVLRQKIKGFLKDKLKEQHSKDEIINNISLFFKLSFEKQEVINNKIIQNQKLNDEDIATIKKIQQNQKDYAYIYEFERTYNGDLLRLLMKAYDIFDIQENEDLLKRKVYPISYFEVRELIDLLIFRSMSYPHCIKLQDIKDKAVISSYGQFLTIYSAILTVEKLVILNVYIEEVDNVFIEEKKVLEVSSKDALKVSEQSLFSKAPVTDEPKCGLCVII